MEESRRFSMKDKDNRGFWQRAARLYAPAMRSSGKLYRAIKDEMRPKLNRKMNVLELACGTGQLSFPLARLARLWEATDFSPAMIAEAKKVYPRPSNLFFPVHDATKLPYADRTFDAILIANALRIMPKPHLALSEIRRVLKKGGALYAPTFIHGEGKAFRFRVWLMERAGFHVFHSRNEKEFTGYLEAQGFTIKTSKPLGTSLAPLCYVEATPKEEQSVTADAQTPAEA